MGQALHSKELTFVHPRTGETIHVETDLPAYYVELLAKLHSESI
jgi:23S rRNA pseudouridine1911/1915/1917 synthase